MTFWGQTEMNDYRYYVATIKVLLIWPLKTDLSVLILTNKKKPLTSSETRLITETKSREWDMML